MACVDVIVTSFHSVVTQSVFESPFECKQFDGDPIAFIKVATNLPPLILPKRLGIKPRSAALNVGAENEIAP
jgi:hypothetical protein